jgi:hypothetical protein
MEPTQELIDDIYREKVLRARKMKPEEKLAAGGKLFAFAVESTKAGIRHQFPGISEERVREIVTERLALQKRLEGTPWN